MADSKVVFGTAEYKDVCTGIYITSVKTDEGSQKAEVMDEEGNVVQQDRYGKNRTVTIDGTVKGDIKALTVGGTITVDGIAYGIDSVSKTKTNTGHYTVSVTASAPFTTATT